MGVSASLSNGVLLSDLDVARALYESGSFAESVDFAKTIYAESCDPEMKFRAILLASAGESEQRRYAAALKTLQLADALLDDAKPVWKANYFCQRAHVNVKLTPKVIDCGVIDYEEAIFYAKQANDLRVEARARNNLARRHSKANRFEEAITEVDAAIRIAARLGEKIELGRFYDQKAQILLDHKQHREAVAVSEKAMRLLYDHPSLAEARTTHGRALVALGAEYLEQEDALDTFMGKKRAAEHLSVSLDANLIQLALDRTNSNLLHASELLQIKHPSLIQAVKKFKVARKPIRRRGKSYEKK